MTDPNRQARREALLAAGAIPNDQPQLTLEDGTRPHVPARVRDGVYWATLGTAAASLLVSGFTSIWLPAIAPEVLASGGVVASVMAIIGGGVGVIYRPGAQR